MYFCTEGDRVSQISGGRGGLTFESMQDIRPHTLCHDKPLSYRPERLHNFTSQMNELNQHEYLLRSVYNTLEGIRGIREAGASDLAIIEILDRSYNVLVKRAPRTFFHHRLKQMPAYEFGRLLEQSDS